jgi:hypothetical protein
VADDQEKEVDNIEERVEEKEKKYEQGLNLSKIIEEDPRA